MALILTSLVPGKRELQSRSVASWRDLGFAAATVNSPGEIELLKREAWDIGLLPAGRDASALAGKPLVYFDDLLKYAGESGSEVCGIVNADVELVAGGDFLQFIADQARGGMVFGSRVDVPAPQAREGEEYGGGFDFFFFDPSIVKMYPAADFCLGLPWWDYWAPLVPLLCGVKPRLLLTPVAYHVRHATNWNLEFFPIVGRRFLGALRALNGSVAFPPEVVRAMDAAERLQAMAPLAYFFCDYIKQNAESLFYAHPRGLPDMAVVSRDHYRRLREAGFAHRQRADELAAAVRERDARLAVTCGSLSWRLTAPLRRAGDAVRKAFGGRFGQ